MWIGGGGVPFEGRRGFLITEGFLARAFGEHANGALYFQPYFLGSYRLAPSVPLEASYLAYVPLNDAGACAAPARAREARIRLGSVPVKWWKFSGVVPEFSTRYAIAARISWVVLDTVGVVSCCIDSALK